MLLFAGLFFILNLQSRHFIKISEFQLCIQLYSDLFIDVFNKIADNKLQLFFINLLYLEIIGFNKKDFINSEINLLT